MLLMSLALCSVPAGSGNRQIPASTSIGNEFSNPAGEASSLVTTGWAQAVTHDFYSHSSRLQHRKETPINGNHSLSRPKRAGVGKEPVDV